MGAAFFSPHEEAAALVQGKPVVTRDVFAGLLPELRARAMVVTGIEGANTVQRIKDEIADYTRGQTDTGKAKTWDEAKAAIAQTLESEMFSADAAKRRATLLLRTHGFQAYQAANWRVAQHDPDTTHLQYLATEDSRVRDSHLALNGIILPKKDPFWAKHYPPWEWGCRCRVRPINRDLLDEARGLDSRRKPEDRLVIEGPALDRLHDGQIVRGELQDRDGRTVAMGAHDVTPPSEKSGAEAAFQWHPDHLRMPLHQILDRYDPEVRDDFLAKSKSTHITPHVTVLDWLEGKALPAKPTSLAGSEGTATTIGLSDARNWPAAKHVPGVSIKEGMQDIASGLRVESVAGTEVRFGEVVSQHFERGGSIPRARFAPIARSIVAAPDEVWENAGRRYYLGRTRKEGMVVIAIRKGEHRDEVITFHPKALSELWKYRQGRLIFQK